MLRVGHADRERVIETLKDAFVLGRLAKDELDARAGQALTARTRADLAALTCDIPGASDIPGAPAAARPERPPAQPALHSPPAPPAPARRRPVARAAAWSGVCLVIAAAALRAAVVLDPGSDGPPGPSPPWASPSLFLLVAFAAVLTALGILVVAVTTAAGEHRRSRRQLPPGAHDRETLGWPPTRREPTG
jgi:hypothetical protein